MEESVQAIDSEFDDNNIQYHEEEQEEEEELDVIINTQMQIPARKEIAVSIKMMDNIPSEKLMEKSTTSFGFDFDEVTKKVGKDLLHEVSLMYLHSHSLLHNQSQKLNNKHSQVSLSIRDSTGESSWFSDSGNESFSLKDVADKIDIKLTLEYLRNLYFEP